MIASAVATTAVKFQAARNQKDIAEQNAERARQEGRAEESRFRRDARRQLGRVRAQFGVSGFDFSGSVFDVLADEQMEIEENALLIRSGGLARASRFENQASAAGARATGTLLAGALSIGSSLNRGAAFQETGDIGFIT